jgi:predicted DNA-binding protein YlxM (UPF0122 family)
MTVWKNELEILQQLIDSGVTLEAIGEKYDVSKQRIYQVIQKYSLRTPVHQRKSFLKHKEPKFYWLARMLSHKKIEKLERLAILTSLEPPDFCPILGLKLNYDGYDSSYERADYSPSIDRIDSSKGYLIDNIQIISWRANRIKNDSTPEELKKIADYMLNLVK